METAEERRQRLYGPIRNLQVEEIRQRLSKSSVLKDGEYNYTTDTLKHVNYGSSYDQDFMGAQPDPSGMPEPKGQLEHHFALGNDSGAQVPVDVYSQSTTRQDFAAKPHSKPEMIADSRVINWPDMAPRYMTSRKMESSEYNSAFVPAISRTTSVPEFPRLRTSKMQLPIDQSRFQKTRICNISLGSDNPSLFSENQRAFGIGRFDGKTPSLAFSKENTDDVNGVSQSMKKLERTSHVFRAGDYNGIIGNFQTTVNDEFGPRTLPPGEQAARYIRATEKKKEDENEDSGVESAGSSTSLPDDVARTSHLAAYARANTVPEVFNNAADGKSYQTSAHFHFGYDPNTKHTMYGKDFALASQAARAPPKQTPTPSAGKLLQNDPAYSKFGTSSNWVDFLGHQPAQPPKNADGLTQMEVNLEKRHSDNIIMSFDLNRHQQDRQKSLAHSDYIGPPADYRPIQPVPSHRVTFDYLTPDDALPYPPSDKMMSEAQNNYIGTWMSGNHATGRRQFKNAQCKQRLADGRSTHFVVGYTPSDFATETQIKFTGDAKNDANMRPAGKTENVASVKFAPLSVSENTQDLRAADPHEVNPNESLTARMAHRRAGHEHPMTTSVMKADFKPFVHRSFTDSQIRTMIDCDKKVSKEIAKSHLFHTDNSGRNHFQTTTMDDFIQPVSMTGRKFLAAR